MDYHHNNPVVRTFIDLLSKRTVKKENQNKITTPALVHKMARFYTKRKMMEMTGPSDTPVEMSDSN
jgi:hypothetical protein